MNKIIYYFNKFRIYIVLCISLTLILFITIISKSNKKVDSKIDDDKIVVSVEKKEEDSKNEVVKIKVDVKGRINVPGVYELDENSRVIDAINMAGGLLEDANTEYLNLSKHLTDEMVIVIYSNSELEKFKETEKQIIYVKYECKCPDNINDACISNNDTVNTLEAKSKDKVEENTNKEDEFPISINEATYDELLKIPGIGDSKAKAIIEYREEFGLFINLEDIKKVSGIGDSLYSKIKEYIKL